MDAYTAQQVARYFGVADETVYAWIESGELVAVNTAKHGTRPRWRVAPEAIQKFEDQRLHDAARSRQKRKRQRRPPVKQYFRHFRDTP